MNIDSITNGVVIDHISAGRGMRLYDLLGLEELDCSIAIIKNVSSKKLGKKDIIKIDSDTPINLAASACDLLNPITCVTISSRISFVIFTAIIYTSIKI